MRSKSKYGFYSDLPIKLGVWIQITMTTNQLKDSDLLDIFTIFLTEKSKIFRQLA